MIFARAHLLRVFYKTVDVRRWQNYSVGKSITESSGGTNKYAYMPFDLPGGSESAFLGSTDLEIIMPATTDNTFVFTYAMEFGLLVEVKTYQFTADVGDLVTANLPQAKSLLSTYTGQVESMNSDMSTVSISVGASQLAVNSSVPPRVFTNFQVGVPYAP